MVPKVVGSSPIFHPKRPSSEGFFYNTQITTHLSFRVHPEKGNIPEFCQDIKPRNRDLQSPNKPHTFAITVFENKEYDKYRPLWKLAPIKSRNRHFIEFWQTSRLAFRVPSAPYFRSEHINEKGSAIIRLPSLFISRGDKIRTCDHTPPRGIFMIIHWLYYFLLIVYVAVNQKSIFYWVLLILITCVPNVFH